MSDPKKRRWSRTAVALMVLIATGLVGTAAAVPVATADATGWAGHHWLTLVTGDMVRLRKTSGSWEVTTVRKGPQREGMKVMAWQENGDQYVVPIDALSLLGSGRVDRRLFNVSQLAESGYHDAGRKDIPLMLAHDGTARLAGAGPVRRLTSIGADATVVSKAQAGLFWSQARGAVSRIWLDAPVRSTLDHSVPQVGAPSAWQGGHTGEGATVAVLDTGIDATHPDLTDAVAGERDFTGSQTGARDVIGHGTHVAGIITGNGAASDGKYIGVAPDARLLNGKVVGDAGYGLESWVIAGMEWAVASGADVVNMSLGGGESDGTNPLDQAVNRLTRQSGTLFVVAAGNAGPRSESISSPGAADEALTVGAVDRQDAIASFSSRGPRRGDLAIKPDLTAPGVDIVSAYADGSLVGELYPIVDGRYVRVPGTSMAAPHVAGAAAILAAQHPGWDAGQIKPALMGSARPQPGLSIHDQGSGRLDLARATAQHVFATPASVGNGVALWPHHDDEPIVNTLTYRNDSTEPVTLTLTVQARDPHGKPAPAGMYTVSPGEVTVPAGGSVTARLTSDTAVPGPDGAYEGQVTASGGPISVRTLFSVMREVESYDMTLNVIDRAGRPASARWVRIVGIDQPTYVWKEGLSSGTTLRVPKGTHYVETVVENSDPAGPWHISMMIEPNVTVGGATTLVLDAREGKPTGAALDQLTEADPAQGLIAFYRSTGWGSGWAGFELYGGPANVFVRPSKTSAPPGQFIYQFVGQYARPDGQGQFRASPYLYHIFWQDQGGRVPPELVRRIRDRELAKVHTQIASTVPGQIASKDLFVDLPTPATLTEYYTPWIAWQPVVLVSGGQQPPEVDVWHESIPVTYRLGKPATQRWNLGVLGPAFPDNSLAGGPFTARHGDIIDVSLPLHSDQSPEHFGFARSDQERTALWRDGKLIGESPSLYAQFKVPTAPGAYRVQAEATRSQSSLSTHVSAAWTFASATVPGEQIQPLPMMAVRFAPALDPYNRAQAGRPFKIPVSVQRQAGAEYGEWQTLTVQVSYDDGRTWRPVRLTGSGQRRTAHLIHPSGDGPVSLRASAADSHGNTVELTIIRAYLLKR